MAGRKGASAARLPGGAWLQAGAGAGWRSALKGTAASWPPAWEESPCDTLRAWIVHPTSRTRRPVAASPTPPLGLELERGPLCTFLVDAGGGQGSWSAGGWALGVHLRPRLRSSLCSSHGALCAAETDTAAAVRSPAQWMTFFPRLFLVSIGFLSLGLGAPPTSTSLFFHCVAHRGAPSLEDRSVGL